MTPSSVIDLFDDSANMYGCQPCPKCTGRFRYCLLKTPDVIQCDDCGFTEPVTERR